MNHKDIGNEDDGRGNVYFDSGKASAQYQKRQKYFFGLSVSENRRFDHQLTEEEMIFYYQAEKLLYNAMKKLIPASAGTYTLCLIETSYSYRKISHIPFM